MEIKKIKTKTIGILGIYLGEQVGGHYMAFIYHPKKYVEIFDSMQSKNNESFYFEFFKQMSEDIFEVPVKHETCFTYTNSLQYTGGFTGNISYNIEQFLGPIIRETLKNEYIKKYKLTGRKLKMFNDNIDLISLAVQYLKNNL